VASSTKLAAQLLRAEALRNNFSIEFEVDLGGLRGDAVMTDKKTGQRICCQIGVSKPDHEVDSIQKFFTLPGFPECQVCSRARDAALPGKSDRSSRPGRSRTRSSSSCTSE